MFSLTLYSPRNTTMSTSTLSTFLLLALLLFHYTNAAVFTIRNNCPYTVWAGAVPGGGRQLGPGQTWPLTVAAGTAGARIWPRTGCNFDGSGRGRCQTGDCNGLLQCQGYGTPPNTLAEYALNQFNNLDFFDISLVDGFNVPMVFRPNSNGQWRSLKKKFGGSESNGPKIFFLSCGFEVYVRVGRR
ncbi:putative Thaumatin family [Helianthus annuus]|nr:putative Thaumatin family [Helianthus annuus]